MVDVAAVRAAIGRIDDILVRRYHYPHPVFEHVAAAREALEADAPEPEAVSSVGLRVEPVLDGPTETVATDEETPSEEASEPEASKPPRPRRAR